MGWASGTDVAIGVWDAVKEFIPESDKPKVANEIIDVLEDQDWDNVGEAEELYEISGRKAKQDAEDAEWERKHL